MNDKWTVTSLDNFTVLLGIGCLFAWIGLLRYFKFNYKFHVSSCIPFSTVLSKKGKAMTRNWSNPNNSPDIETKMGNNQIYKYT